MDTINVETRDESTIEYALLLHSTHVFLKTQGGAKKRGHHLIANILKFHDRIAWKLVNFCNIIC